MDQQVQHNYKILWACFILFYHQVTVSKASRTILQVNITEGQINVKHFFFRTYTWSLIFFPFWVGGEGRSDRERERERGGGKTCNLHLFLHFL
jgi:hypothetical protein